ncbi:MAG: high-potential iron-sulfur protein [Gammaproteobacteria bacterium]|nr:high-potential iron-sulfur protein [Gammaproteobacteria bacterium]
MKSAGAVVVATTSGLSIARAEENFVKVDENGPMARALNYVHDARSVDAAKRPSNRFCYNCALYAGDRGDDWADCSIFPGKKVAGEGWCSAWAPKQDNS